MTLRAPVIPAVSCKMRVVFWENRLMYGCHRACLYSNSSPQMLPRPSIRTCRLRWRRPGRWHLGAVGGCRSVVSARQAPLRPWWAKDPNGLQSPGLDSKYDRVSHLLHNEEARITYIDKLANNETQDIDVAQDFLHSLDMAELSPSAVELLIATWEHVFNTRGAQARAWQRQLLEYKDRFVHVLINTKKYSAYERLVRPLLSKHKPTWADKMAQTYKLESSPRGIQFDNVSILQTINGVSRRQKRQLITSFIRKSLIHAENNADKYEVVDYGLRLMDSVGDGFLTTAPDRQQYKPAMRLIALDRALVEALEPEVNRLYGINAYNNLLTSLMESCTSSDPKTTLYYWEEKKRLVAKYPRAITSEDVKYAMMAFSEEKQFKEAMALYDEYPNLQNDDQIEVVLSISERQKDWKLLQKQFEDMYGRGQLPYVVHYAVVMNALASRGAKKEVAQLYEQLLRRNLAPNALIYAALINVEIYTNNLAGAQHWFDEYCKKQQDGDISAEPSAYLYGLMLEHFVRSSNLPGAMDFLESSLQRQHNTRLFDSTTLAKLANFSATDYSLSGVERVRQIAEKGPVTDEYYADIIRCYTRLGEYAKAEQLAYEAHGNSLVPFRSAVIYKAQLRNYRFWIRETTNTERKAHLVGRLWVIINRIYTNQINPVKTAGLYAELIKYFVGCKRIGEAYKVLSTVESRSVLSEDHYLPILKYLCRNSSFENDTQVLNLYRDMVGKNIEVTAQLYVFLLQALINFDQRGQKGFDNSYRLLQSVFEMNGLRLDEPQPKTFNPNLQRDLVPMCRMVAMYATANPNDVTNSRLLTTYLNQVKHLVDHSLSKEFRFVIYYELARLYHLQGDTKLTLKLVDSAIDEIHSFVDAGSTVARLLQLQYRKLVALKLEQLDQDELPLDIYSAAESRGLLLPGHIYNNMIAVMCESKDPAALHAMLNICEKYLIWGNLAERQRRILLGTVYGAYVSYLHESKTKEELRLQQGPLLRYYNVDLIALRQGPYKTFVHQLSRHNNVWMKSHPWTADAVLAEPSHFFNPETRLNSENKLTHANVTPLRGCIIDACKTQHDAFKLMDTYPLTVEYLLHNTVSRYQHREFRLDIDQILPPHENETYSQRRLRTVQALDKIRASS